MISVLLRVRPEDAELASAELWEAGTAGITEEPDGLRAFFEREADAQEAAARLSRFSPELRVEETRDWCAEVREAWPSTAVGELFYLVPEWSDEPAPPGRLRLTIHPGMACGTGAAPATQLCLRMLERARVAGRVVVDVGTGTGILAEAARLLGAARVFACDIEHEASRIARANLPGVIHVFTGSARCLRSRSAGLIVANLNAATLHSIAKELVRAADRDARFVLAGFRDDEADPVAAAFGLHVRDRLSDNEWSCLLL